MAARDFRGRPQSTSNRGGSDPDNITDRILMAIEQVNVEHPRFSLSLVIVILTCSLCGASVRIQTAGSYRARPAQYGRVNDLGRCCYSGSGGHVLGDVFPWSACTIGRFGLKSNSNRANTGQHGHGHTCSQWCDADLAKIAEKLNWILQSEDARQKMSASGRELVDGRGAAMF